MRDLASNNTTKYKDKLASEPTSFASTSNSIELSQLALFGRISEPSSLK